MQSEPEAARAALQQSVELGRRIGDDWAVADGLKMITVAWVIQEDHEGGRQALADLLRVARRLGNEFFIAWYHAGVGFLDLHEGNFETAKRELDLSIEHCERVGDPATRGLAISWRGQLDGLTGEHAAAGARLEALLARASASGGGIAVPDAVVQLATVAVGCGDPDAARVLVQPLADTMREFGMPVYQSWAQSILGAALATTGDHAGARTALEEAKAAAQSIDNLWLIAMADHWLGKLARRAGETGRAEQLHHEALELQHRRNLRPGIVESLEALAALAADHESPAEAARLFGAADALRHSIGTVRWPAEQAGYDDDLAHARAQLADDEFDAAWTQGAALSIDDAIEYVSRARGERKRPTTGWESLTPTEERVVALAAEGLTNPQIAERLFVARGTVKVHLEHIFTKLAVSTRAELAAQATKRALQPAENG
jgi:ATP/maltotriose-dependent transcriptional regulator MalT